MSIRGVIFDLDGTLVDTLPDIADAVNAGLESVGKAPRAYDEVKQWIGTGIINLCELSLQGDTGVDLDRLVATVTAEYARRRMNKVKLYPGIAELLDTLTRRGIPMAILSNKPHEHTAPMCDKLFSRWSFVAVEGFHTEETRKPDPRLALDIVGKMNLETHAVAMVGDSAPDMQTAVNARLLPVGVTWGYRTREQLLAAGAEQLIDQPAELLNLLK